MLSRKLRYTHKIKMDYSKKNLDNPFHKQNRGIKRDELSLRLKMSCIVLLVIFIALLYLMFFSAVFNIKKIEVTGLYRINTGDVEKIAREQTDQNRYWLFKQRNILIFNKDSLYQSLTNKYHFKEIKIKKGLFHTLKINLSEREYGYIWQEKDKYYYIDKNGYLIEELSLNLPPIIDTKVTITNSSTNATNTNLVTTTASTEIPNDYYKTTILAAKTISQDSYPIIINISEERFKDYKVDIDQVYLDFSSQFSNKIKASNEPELTVKYFIIDKDFNTIKAILDNGLTIYFSTKEDRDAQIRNLLVLKKSESYKLIKKKIDLRYGDKVYYE